MNHSQVFSAFYNAPWFLTREKMTEIDAFLRQRLGGGGIELTGERLESRRAGQDQPRAQRAASAIAVIPIQGVLLQRPGFFDELFGASSIARLTKLFRAALADPSDLLVLAG